MRVLGRVVSDVVKLHVLCKLVLIDGLHDVAAIDAVIVGLRQRLGEFQEFQSSADWTAPVDGEPSDEGGRQLKTVLKAVTRAKDDLLKRRVALMSQCAQ